MAVKDFDWMGDKLGSATKNLRAKAGTKVEQTISDWLTERIEFAQSLLEQERCPHL